eukprot:XP_001695828.1 predicted protein [Chlamydomonas reinhardtii]
MADDLGHRNMLEGCSVHVWQRVDGDVSTTQAINAKLRALGAKTLPRLTKDVTHVIFQRKLQSTAQERNAEDGDLRTIYSKVGKYEPRVFVVSPLWLHHCEDTGTRAKEIKYLERKPADPIFLIASPNKTASAGAKRKRKSLARPRELVETADVHDALFSSSQQIRDLSADEPAAPLYIRPMFDGPFAGSAGGAAEGRGGGAGEGAGRGASGLSKPAAKGAAQAGAATLERNCAAALSDVEEEDEEVVPRGAPSAAAVASAEEVASTAARLGQAAVPIAANGGAATGTTAAVAAPGPLPPRAKSVGRRSTVAQDAAAMPGPSSSLPAAGVAAPAGSTGPAALTSAVAAALAAVPGGRPGSAGRRVARASCAGTPLGGSVALAMQSAGKLGRPGMRTPLGGTPGPFGFTPLGTMTVPRLKSQSSGGYGSSQSASATPELTHGLPAAPAGAAPDATAREAAAASAALEPQRQQVVTSLWLERLFLTRPCHSRCCCRLRKARGPFALKASAAAPPTTVAAGPGASLAFAFFTAHQQPQRTAGGVFPALQAEADSAAEQPGPSLQAQQQSAGPQRVPPAGDGRTPGASQKRRRPAEAGNDVDEQDADPGTSHKAAAVVPSPAPRTRAQSRAAAGASPASSLAPSLAPPQQPGTPGSPASPPRGAVRPAASHISGTPLTSPKYYTRMQRKRFCRLGVDLERLPPGQPFTLQPDGTAPVPLHAVREEAEGEGEDACAALSEEEEEEGGAAHEGPEQQGGDGGLRPTRLRHAGSTPGPAVAAAGASRRARRTPTGGARGASSSAQKGSGGVEAEPMGETTAAGAAAVSSSAVAAAAAPPTQRGRLSLRKAAAPTAGPGPNSSKAVPVASTETGAAELTASVVTATGMPAPSVAAARSTPAGRPPASKPATGRKRPAAAAVAAGVKRPRASATKAGNATATKAGKVTALATGALLGSAAFNSAIFMDGIASAFPSASTASAGAPAGQAAAAAGAGAAGAPALGQYPRGKDHPMRAGVRYLAHTSVEPAVAAAVSAAVRQLGGARLCTPGYEDGHVTHLVVGVPDRRTVKVLLGVANGAVFVSPAWVTQSLAAGRWLPERDFRVPGPFAATADAVRCNGPRLAEAQARKADVEKLVVALGGRVVPVRSATLLIMLTHGRSTLQQLAQRVYVR